MAIERKDLENHLHMQIVVSAMTKSAKSFEVLVRKYIGWHGVKYMNHILGKVMFKVLSKRMLHTYKGMIGYCLKYICSVHFDCAMYNVFEANVKVGKI